MKAAVVVFSGTNCQVETNAALEACAFEAKYVDSSIKNLDEFDCVFLCGGFSYGDYIRSGRLAKFTPVVGALEEYIEKQRGVTVGICNGFQILCEAHLLKGALLENDSSRFICKNVELKLDFKNVSKKISLPIAHREGKYVFSASDYKEVFAMSFLKYVDNPNGSYLDIAGLYDKNRRVMGLMPHPERAMFAKNFGFDGEEIFKIVKEEIKRG